MKHDLIWSAIGTDISVEPLRSRKTDRDVNDAKKERSEYQVTSSYRTYAKQVDLLKIILHA